jgi:hypothetical protein
MNCPYCNKPAKFAPNEEFYGKRYGKSYMCYYCKDVYIVPTSSNPERQNRIFNKIAKMKQMKLQAKGKK